VGAHSGRAGQGARNGPSEDELTGQAGGGWVRAHLARARPRMRAARVLISPQGAGAPIYLYLKGEEEEDYPQSLAREPKRV
jgi:hypothetical protein